jgi:hypothetical protein
MPGAPRSRVLLLAPLVWAALSGSAGADETPAAILPRAHQALIMPTALTQPSLTFSADVYNVMPGLTLTPVWFLQLQVAGFAGFKQFSFGVASMKVRVLRTRYVSAAAFGQYVGYTFTPSNEGRYRMVGGVVTACSNECSHWISLLGAAGIHDKTVDTSPSKDVGLVVGLNGYTRLSEKAGLVAEVNRMGARGWEVGVALRWSLRHLGLDVGALFINVDGLPVLPWIALSYAPTAGGR